MKTIGWCEKCHRVRRVRVSAYGYMKPNSAPTGICDDCEEESSRINRK